MRSKSGRGFASMDPDQQKIIASRGGRTAHERGRAHEFTSEEATAAGSKGGKVVSKDRAHMARIGRLGGQAKARRRKAGKAGKAGKAHKGRK